MANSTEPSDKNAPNIYQISHTYQIKNLYIKHLKIWQNFEIWCAYVYIYTLVGKKWSPILSRRPHFYPVVELLYLYICGDDTSIVTLRSAQTVQAPIYV